MMVGQVGHLGEHVRIRSLYAGLASGGDRSFASVK